MALIALATGAGGVVATRVDKSGNEAQDDTTSQATTIGETTDSSKGASSPSVAGSGAVGESTSTSSSSTTAVAGQTTVATATTVAGGTPVTTVAPPSATPTTVATTPPPAATTVPVASAGPSGGPVPVGTIADIGGGWRLQVVNVNRDAAAVVAAENPFNQPPPAGSTLTLITVALGYFGMDDPKSAFNTFISAVGSTNAELAAECGVLPQELNTFGEFFSGGVMVGNVCFVTTPQDAASLRLLAAGDAAGSEVLFDASPPPAGVVPMVPLSGPQPGAASTPARLAPTPLGVAGDIGDGWKLTVAGASDITDAVLGENQFNEPPPAGYRFMGVNVTYQYVGAGTATAFSVIANAVGSANLALSTDCGVTPQRIDLTEELSAGGAVSGILCFVAPATNPSLTLYATADFSASNVMFATS